MQRALLIASLLVAATLVVYGQVGGFAFVHIDDPQYMELVPEGAGLDALLWSWTSLEMANWHPLTWYSYALDATWFGRENSGGFHCVNLAFHLLGTLLCFGAVRALTRRDWESGFVAAMFALHPMHVESVAWISERKDVLSGVAWWGTLWAYARYVRARETGRPATSAYIAALLLFALGWLSKPLVATLPCVLLLLDRWPLARRFDARLLWEKLPFFALTVGGSVLAYHAQTVGGAVVATERVSMGGRLANAAVAYVGYLERTVWPRDLAVFYPHPQMAGQTPLSAAEVGFAFLLLAGITAAVLVAARRGSESVAVGWFWFVGTMVPMVGLVQVGFAASADRYAYVPHAGLALAVAFGVGDVVRRRASWRIPVASVAVAVLLVWTWQAHRQTALWRDTRALFEHTLARTSNNGFIHYNFGHWLQGQGEIDAAKHHYRTAYDIDRRRTGAGVNLGALLFLEGERDAGLQLLEEAVELRPSDALANFNMGHAMRQVGDRDRARVFYRRVFDARPAAEKRVARQARGQLAALALLAGDRAEAVEHYEQLIAADGAKAEPIALRGLAWIYATTPGLLRPERAVELAERALASEPQPDARSLETAAAAQASLGDFERARELQARALERLEPGDPRVATLRERLRKYQRDEPHHGPPAL